MHIGSNPDDHTTLDAHALPTLIARLAAAACGFATLNALL
jgi:peptidoglycan-N-acetylglucosamine deacetylase